MKKFLLFIAFAVFSCTNSPVQTTTDARLQITANLSDEQRYPLRFVAAAPNPSSHPQAIQRIDFRNISSGTHNVAKWRVRALSSGALLYVNPKDTLVPSFNVNGDDNNALILGSRGSTSIAISPLRKLVRPNADTLILIAPDGKTVQVFSWTSAPLNGLVRP